MDASILNYTVNDNVGEFLSKDKKLYINGDWVDPSSGKSFDVEDPATGKKIATCSAGNSKDIDAAVKAARVAFDSGAWTDVPNNEKGKIIWKIGDLIDKHGEELAQLESLDNQLPLQVQQMSLYPLIFLGIWQAGLQKLKETPYRTHAYIHLVLSIIVTH